MKLITNSRYRNRVLLGLILIAMILIYMGGHIFYKSTLENVTGWMLFGMCMQNCMESLLFNPTLTIREMVSSEGFMASVEGFDNVLIGAYGVAMVVVPAIDILIVFSILDSFLHIFTSFSICKKRVLIVGYNEKVKKLIGSGITKGKIYLWTPEAISSDEDKNYALKKVAVYAGEYSLGDAPDRDKYEAQKRRFNKFLRHKRINHVVLLDEFDSKNIQFYIALADCEYCSRRTVHFYACVDKYEDRLILENYFDRQLVENYGKHDGKSREDMDKMGEAEYEIWANSCKLNPNHMDLSIFNYPEIQAKLLFDKLPIYSGLEESETKNVHMLIVGGGEEGENILLAAMNRGVLSSDNIIIIDVIDLKPLELFERLKERFDPGYVNMDEANLNFEIKAPDSDGYLQINLHEADAESPEFSRLVFEMQEGEGKDYTYIAICLPNEDMNLHCAIAIDKTLKDNENQIEVPVAMRMTYSMELKQYMKENLSCYSDVFFMGANEEYITLDNIVNDEEERCIAEYSRIHEELGNNRIDSTAAKTKKLSRRTVRTLNDNYWSVQRYYQKRSCKALYEHISTKKALFKDYSEEKVKYLNEAKKNKGATAWSNILIKTEGETPKYPILLEMARTEHRRFCYFYASEGWGFSDWKTVDIGKGEFVTNDKKPFTREHGCLTNWANLAKSNNNWSLVYDLLWLIAEGDKNDETEVS